MSTKLTTIAERLDAELRLAEIPDFPGACNGLQMANRSGKVRKVAVAVDACLASMQMAVEAGADLLLVHHGMFWNGQQMLIGAAFEKLRTALDGGLAVYSAHLPLDVHPTMGNNVLLGQACGLSGGEPIVEWKGIHLGLRYEAEVSRADLANRFSAALDAGRVHVCAGGPEICRRVVLVTGGAGAEVGKLSGIADTFLTGEGPHWSYTLAEELGINVFYGGHYATETFGVKALGAWLEREFGLAWIFLDHPTGL
jgi:dinuclear metal center YbgI/SA1388 family protein